MNKENYNCVLVSNDEDIDWAILCIIELSEENKIDPASSLTLYESLTGE